MTKQKNKHPIYYHYGYKIIKPLGKDKEEWDMSIQLHKNQNGKHFDIRLHRPGEDKAYSWSMKKIPLNNIKPVLAIRTHDHNISHMDFEGPMSTTKGFGEVKLVRRGKINVEKINDNGIHFTFNKQKFRLRPYQGKKYMFERILD